MLTVALLRLRASIGISRGYGRSRTITGDPTLNAADELKGDPIWPNKVSILMVFLLGLLLPIYTITGYDASAHTSEETHKAAMTAPRGMVSSVIWSCVFGYVMLIGIRPRNPRYEGRGKQGWNVFFWTSIRFCRRG